MCVCGTAPRNWDVTHAIVDDVGWTQILLSVRQPERPQTVVPLSDSIRVVPEKLPALTPASSPACSLLWPWRNRSPRRPRRRQLADPAAGAETDLRHPDVQFLVVALPAPNRVRSRCCPRSSPTSPHRAQTGSQSPESPVTQFTPTTALTCPIYADSDAADRNTPNGSGIPVAFPPRSLRLARIIAAEPALCGCAPGGNPGQQDGRGSARRAPVAPPDVTPV